MNTPTNIFEVSKVTSDAAQISYDATKSTNGLTWYCTLCTLSGTAIRPVPVDGPVINIQGLSSNEVYLLDFVAKTAHDIEVSHYNLGFCTKPLYVGTVKDLQILFEGDFASTGRCKISFTQPELAYPHDAKVSYLVSFILNGKIYSTNDRLISYSQSNKYISNDVLLSDLAPLYKPAKGDVIQVGIQTRIETGKGDHLIDSNFPKCSKSYYVRPHRLRVNNMYTKVQDTFKKCVFTSKL